MFAIKSFKVVEDYNTYGFPATTMREVSALKSLSHENLVRLVGVKCESIQEIYMVFEFVPLNLHQYIDHKRKAGQKL